MDEQQKAAMAQYVAQYGHAAQAPVEKDINTYVELGRSHYGQKAFDEAAENVVKKLGDRKDIFRAAAAGFNAPHAIVKHLDENEGRLEAMAKMRPEEMIIEMARIEAQMGGQAGYGAEPAYRQEAKSGRVPYAEWQKNGGDNIKDDKEWARQHDLIQAERRKRGR